MRKILIGYFIILLLTSLSACEHQSCIYRPTETIGLYYKIVQANDKSKMGVITYVGENEDSIIIPCEYDTIYYVGSNSMGIFIAETNLNEKIYLSYDKSASNSLTQSIDSFFQNLRIAPDDIDSPTLLGHRLFRVNTHRGNYYVFLKSNADGEYSIYNFGPYENFIEGKDGYFAKVNGKWGYAVFSEDYKFNEGHLDCNLIVDTKADSIIQIAYPNSDDFACLYHTETGWESVNKDGLSYHPNPNVVNYILSKYNINKAITVIELKE